MKKNSVVYQLLLALALCGFTYCGGNGKHNNTGGEGYDSTTSEYSDSMNAAHHVDPANAYPQPPVTGSNQDSSRTQDSSRLRDTQNRPGY